MRRHWQLYYQGTSTKRNKRGKILHLIAQAFVSPLSRRERPEPMVRRTQKQQHGETLSANSSLTHSWAREEAILDDGV